MISQDKVKIIKTGGHNINLKDRYFIQESPVFLCLVILRISLKEKMNWEHRMEKNTFGTSGPPSSHLY